MHLAKFISVSLAFTCGMILGVTFTGFDFSGSKDHSDELRDVSASENTIDKNAHSVGGDKEASRFNSHSESELFELVERDPLRALASWKSSKDDEGRLGLRNDLVIAWAKTAPLNALEYIQNNIQGIDALYVKSKVLADWSYQDITATFDYLEALPEGDETTILMNSLIDQWSVENGQTIDKFLNLKILEDHRDYAIKSKLSQYGITEYSSSLSWIDTHLSGYEQSEARLKIYSDLSAYSPRLALGAIDSLEESDVKERAFQSLVESWASVDIEGAFEWLVEQPDGEQLDNYYQILMFEFAENHPESATSQLSSIEDESIRSGMAQILAEDLFARDPKGAVDWASELDDGIQSEAIGTIIGQWVQSDPSAALNYALNISKKTKVDDVLFNVFQHMAVTQPEFLAPSIDSFSDQQLKEQAIELLAGEWSRVDSTGSQKWIEGLSNPKDADTAMRSVVQQVGSYKPEYAFTLAANIIDKDLRLELLTSAALNWSSKDHTSAMDALSKANISNEESDIILNKLEQYKEKRASMSGLYIPSL